MVKLEGKLNHIAPKSKVLLEVPVNENAVKTMATFLRHRQVTPASTSPQTNEQRALSKGETLWIRSEKVP
jgi:hypothetical protein